MANSGREGHASLTLSICSAHLSYACSRLRAGCALCISNALSTNLRSVALNSSKLFSRDPSPPARKAVPFYHACGFMPLCRGLGLW